MSEMLERLDVIERKAIVRMLIMRAARAQIHKLDLPWWAWLTRRKHNWSIVMMTLAAADIERGEQHVEQSHWLADIEGGQAIVEGIERSVAKRSNPLPTEAPTASATGRAADHSGVAGLGGE